MKRLFSAKIQTHREAGTESPGYQGRGRVAWKGGNAAFLLFFKKLGKFLQTFRFGGAS